MGNNANLEELKSNLVDLAHATVRRASGQSIPRVTPRFNWSQLPRDLMSLYRENTEAMLVVYEEALAAGLKALDTPLSGAEPIEATWVSVPVPEVPSEVSNFLGTGWNQLVCSGDGTVYAVGHRALAVAKWSDAEGWLQHIDFQDALNSSPGLLDGRALFVRDGRGSAVGVDGGVYELEEQRWIEKTPAGEHLDGLWGFDVAWNSAEESLLVHTGFKKQRRATASFLLRNGVWKKLTGKKSPKLADLAWNDKEHGFTPEFTSFVEAGTNRAIRLGYQFAEVFEGGAWKAGPVSNMERFVCTGDKWAVHSPSRGETLIYGCRDGRITRFDLEGCELVGCAVPPEVAGQVHLKSWCFDDANQRIIAFSQNGEQRWDLDLGACFARAGE